MTDTADAEVEQLRRRVIELEGALDQVREEHRIEREHDRLRHQDHALGLIAQAEAAHEKNLVLTRRVRRARERVEELEGQAQQQRDSRAELGRVYASRSWRLGHALTRPGRARRP